MRYWFVTKYGGPGPAIWAMIAIVWIVTLTGFMVFALS